MSERHETMHIGQEGRQLRRKRIKTLISVVQGNYGWRKTFALTYPAFDSFAGTTLLNLGQQGRADDPALLEALEEWIPHVISTEPEWWVKRPNPLPEL